MNYLSVKQKIKESCQYDHARFSLMFFGPMNHYGNTRSNHIKTGKVPGFHRYIYQKVADRNIKYLVIAVPRDHGKSTIISNIGIIHDIVYGNEEFILLLSETGHIARNNLNAIIAELMHNEWLQEIYGDHVGTEKWTETEIETKRGIYLLSKGMDSQVRSLKRGAFRPTKIVLDDPQSTKSCITADRRDNARLTINTDILPSLDRDKGIFRAIGTIVHADGLTANWMTDRRFEKIFYQAIINDENADPEINGPRRALWEDKFSLVDLDTEKEDWEAAGFGQEWSQERMNIPITGGNKLTEHLYAYSGEFHLQPNSDVHVLMIGGMRIPVRTFVGVDFAAKDNRNADWTVVISAAVDAEGNWYILDLWRKKTEDPVETAMHIYWQAFRAGAYAIFAEDAATLITMSHTFDTIQNDKVTFGSLAKNYDFVPEQLRNTFVHTQYPSITPVKHERNPEGKRGRIFDTLAQLFKLGKIQHQSHMYAFIDEMLTYPQSKNDDIADCLQIIIHNGRHNKPPMAARPEIGYMGDIDPRYDVQEEYANDEEAYADQRLPK